MDEVENNYFPLSAISHYAFCPRRCALIHNEQTWTDNYFTASGKGLHAVVDSGVRESRRGWKIARSLRLVSRELGSSGLSDAVEFVRDDEYGVSVLHWAGKWRPYPIEYKRGTARNDEPYRQQLCAQAICLEEMFGVAVDEGALYLGSAKRRMVVEIDDSLRIATRETVRRIRQLLNSGDTPRAEFGPHCGKCSLVDECMPCLNGMSARQWILGQLKEFDERYQG